MLGDREGVCGFGDEWESGVGGGEGQCEGVCRPALRA